MKNIRRVQTYMIFLIRLNECKEFMHSDTAWCACVAH